MNLSPHDKWSEWSELPMILFEPYPGMLISRDSNQSVYESMSVTQFTEDELKAILVRPFTLISANNNKELVKFLGAVVRFTNSGALLTDGSDLIMKQDTVVTSEPLPALMFLDYDAVIHVNSTFPPEEPYGVPVTLVSNAEYVFEEGSGGSIITIMSVFKRVVLTQ